VNREAALRKRLGSYWKIELSCAVLVPAAALMRAPPSEWREAVAMGAAILPVSILLVLGGLYWRAVYRKAEGHKDAVARVLRAADAAERPVILLLMVAAVALAVAYAAYGWTPPVIAAAVLTVLAGLEYVNYYRVQLQNFDNPADIKRLLRTRRFRRAHLARDLESFRKRRAA
jgi:fatty acid desaturase